MNVGPGADDVGLKANEEGGTKTEHWTHRTAAAAAQRPPQRQRRTTVEQKMMMDEESCSAAEEVVTRQKSLRETRSVRNQVGKGKVIANHSHAH